MKSLNMRCTLARLGLHELDLDDSIMLIQQAFTAHYYNDKQAALEKMALEKMALEDMGFAHPLEVMLSSITYEEEE